MPSAIVNQHPAYRSLPDTASANTAAPRPISEPSDVQLLPSHLAMELAALPPAVVKLPPAYPLLPDTASAYTGPFSPEPSADQLLPSHLAMLLASTSPTRAK